MYNLLVVDDERYAIEGISQGIDWSDVPLEHIFEARSSKEAKAIMQREKVDVIICDIEMPEENGIELIDWVRQHYADMETIFLTGHADFNYAQQAIHLGSFDYILKPVDHDELKETVLRAIRKLEQEREMKDFNKLYRHYYEQWEKHAPLIAERFWQDLLSQRIPAAEEGIQAALKAHHLTLSPQLAVTPILISVEQWHKELNARDEEIMEYALRKCASELFLQEQAGVVIQDKNGVNIALLFDDGAALTKEVLAGMGRRFVAACNQYFYCNVSCYIGKPCSLSRLSSAYEELLEMEHDNVSRPNDVHHLAGDSSRRFAQPSMPHLQADDWIVLFETNRRQELLRKIGATVKEMESAKPTPESIDAFICAVKHMLYRVYHKKGLSIYGQFSSKNAPRSIDHLKSWAERLVSDSMEHYVQQNHNNSSVIDKVNRYIDENLNMDLNREDIALHVFLNPAYLSRLYKKETGTVLSDYMMQARMRKAKSLLAETNYKVSEIAENVGYKHFSHFAKVFKKMVGVGPQEYRKKYQK